MKQSFLLIVTICLTACLSLNVARTSQSFNTSFDQTKAMLLKAIDSHNFDILRDDKSNFTIQFKDQIENRYRYTRNTISLKKANFSRTDITVKSMQRLVSGKSKRLVTRESYWLNSIYNADNPD